MSSESEEDIDKQLTAVIFQLMTQYKVPDDLINKLMHYTIEYARRNNEESEKAL